MRSTVTGKLCQYWSSHTPHGHIYINASMYADGSVERAENFCRNPDKNFDKGAWCYTIGKNVRWEMCNVPMCPSTNSARAVRMQL